MHFTVYDIRDCLYDNRRTQSFAKAIGQSVKRGAIVADAGSGSGILGLLALQAGAAKVYAIEMNPRQKRIILENARLNGFKNKIKVIIGDARKIRLPEKADVILCELIHTATLFEPQMQVIDHLKKYLKPGGRVLPERLYSYVELVAAQENFYGLKLAYESRPNMFDQVVSNKQQFDEIWFTDSEPLKLRTIVKLTACKKAAVNAVRFSGRLLLADKIYLEETPHLLMPEVIFLKKPFLVLPKKDYYLEIIYQGGADSLNVNIKRLDRLTKAALAKCNYLAQADLLNSVS